MNQRTCSGGFTMIEFTLVVAISGILILGLGALVDVPLQMAEQQMVGGSTVSSADRALAILGQEVRFARNIDSPDPRTLLVTDQAGNPISYVWDGVVGGGLTRTSLDGSAAVLKNIQSLDFTLVLADMRVDPGDGLTSDTLVQTAGFTTFNLKSGYKRSGSPGPTAPGTVVVDVSITTVSLSSTSHGGIAFTASGLSADAGLPVSVTVQAQRSGPAKLAAHIYAADSTGIYPDRTREVAVGRIDNGAIPLAFADVSIPLTPSLNLVEGGRYFLVLRSPPSAGRSADMRVRTVSDPAAVTPSNQGFLHSANNGGDYASLSDPRLDASQTIFQVEVQSTAVVGGPGANTVQVPTSVDLKLQLVSAEGQSNLQTSFTVENNVALVSQSYQK